MKQSLSRIRCWKAISHNTMWVWIIVLIVYNHDKEGNEVVTKLNEEILENIAKNASGSYIYANQTEEVVALVKNELKNIAKASVKAQQIAQQKSQYQWFLGVAVVLILLDKDPEKQIFFQLRRYF